MIYVICKEINHYNKCQNFMEGPIGLMFIMNKIECSCLNEDEQNLSEFYSHAARCCVK